MNAAANKLASQISAVVTTLAEFNTGCPSSSIYLAMGCDYSAWAGLSSVMERANLITVRNHFVTLTAKGKKLADDINQVLAEKAAAGH